MSRPTAVVRFTVFDRDGYRCVRCAAWSPLEFQHRQATGMGGRIEKPTVVDGVTACTVCNNGFEHRFQRQALLNGWKVRRWVKDGGRVPVLYPLLGGWHVLTPAGGRELITRPAARALMVDVYGEDEYEKWEKAA